jgi:hypothetical protein
MTKNINIMNQSRNYDYPYNATSLINTPITTPHHPAIKVTAILGNLEQKNPNKLPMITDPITINQFIAL